MKILSMTALIALSFAINTAPSSAVAADQSEVVQAKAKSKSKSEPAPTPKDEAGRGPREEFDPRREAHEGNGRNEGGAFDGGGYRDETGNGMGSEVFYVKHPGKDRSFGPQVEDRGDVLIYTSVTHEDISASETCTTVTRVTVDKATAKTLETDTTEYCNKWPL